MLYFTDDSNGVRLDYDGQKQLTVITYFTGDHYEDGLGYDGRPITKSDIFLTGGNRPRALPAPAGRGYY